MWLYLYTFSYLNVDLLGSMINKWMSLSFSALEKYFGNFGQMFQNDKYIFTDVCPKLLKNCYRG